MNQIIKELKNEIKELKEEVKELKNNIKEKQSKKECEKTDTKLSNKNFYENLEESNKGILSDLKQEDSTLLLEDENSHDLKMLCVFAFDVLISSITKNKIKNRFPNSLKNKKFPLFVNWLIGKEKKVRGSVGTFESNNLEENLKKYSIYSVNEDSSHPIKEKEIKDLSCQINLIYNFENAKDSYDWEIGKHGISVKFGSYGWTFLPQVMIENNYCKTETLENLIKCAGYSGELKDVEKK